jgi:hypothetical protein
MFLEQPNRDRFEALHQRWKPAGEAVIDSQFIEHVIPSEGRSSDDVDPEA